MAGNPDQAHQALMASPPHRENLLSPNFNVAGFGVFRSGHMIYVAQDFASSLPSYSVQQARGAGLGERRETARPSQDAAAAARG